MISTDYLVVGSGLTGATVARVLADAGHKVVVLERRKVLGGNVHDFRHRSGVRVHSHGPHYFRTSSPLVWNYVNRFATFYPFRPTVRTSYQGRLYAWPLKRRGFGKLPAAGNSPPLNFEAACLQLMPSQQYRRFVENYTRRQWGIEPARLCPSLAARIRINEKSQNTLTPERRFQGLPADGYTAMMQSMLAGIPCVLGTDYLASRNHFRARVALVFTGAIDEFFGFDAGRLAYRSQERKHQYQPDRAWAQCCVQINHADVSNSGPIRTVEWKHCMRAEDQARTSGTLLSEEFPFSPGDPDQYEYPVPTPQNERLFAAYQERARRMPGLVICGRLGSYSYLDMDQAIAGALQLGTALSQQKQAHLELPPTLRSSWLGEVVRRDGRPNIHVQ